jgi:PST family polysaccharide transporter
MISKIFPARLLKNFISLGFLQAANFIISLVLAPYVIRNVGIEKYGAISVALAIAVFFSIATDYGFNLSATRDVSLNRNNTNKLGSITSRVLVCKLILLLVSAGLFSILIFSVPSFRIEWRLHILSFPIVLGQATLPFWFFQGIERMKYITYLSLVSRVLSIILIFSFVHESSDYIFVNLISGLTTFLSSAISIFMAYSRYNLKFILPTVTEILSELKSGFLIFASNLSNAAYSFSNIIILNLLVSDKALVGSYSVAEKVIVIIKQLLIIYSQVIYPYLCNLVTTGFREIKNFFYRSYLPFVALIALGTIALFIIAPWIILFLSGVIDESAVFLLRMLAFVPLIIALNIPFYQILLIYNFKKAYSTILIAGAVLNLAMNVFLTYHFQATGTAISIILTETLITSAFFLAVKKKINLLNTITFPDATL